MASQSPGLRGTSYPGWDRRIIHNPDGFAPRWHNPVGIPDRKRGQSPDGGGTPAATNVQFMENAKNSPTFLWTGEMGRRASCDIPILDWRPACVKPPLPTKLMPFRTAFCRAFNLSDERFEAAVLRRCFPWWSRALGSVVLGVNPGIFRREFRVITQLGRSTDPSQFGAEFEAYVYETVRDKARFRTRRLGLRLSRRRFERLAAEVRRRNGNGKVPAQPSQDAMPTSTPPDESALRSQ